MLIHLVAALCIHIPLRQSLFASLLLLIKLLRHHIHLLLALGEVGLKVGDHLFLTNLLVVDE